MDLVALDEVVTNQAPKKPNHSYYIVFSDYFSYNRDFEQDWELEALRDFIKFHFTQGNAVYLVAYERPLSHILPEQENPPNLTVRKLFRILLDSFKKEGIALELNKFPDMDKVYKPTACLLGTKLAGKPFQLVKFIDQIDPLQGLNLPRNDSDANQTIIFKDLASLGYSYYNGFKLERFNQLSDYLNSPQFKLNRDVLERAVADKKPALDKALFSAFKTVSNALLPPPKNLQEIFLEIGKRAGLVIIFGLIAVPADRSEFLYSERFSNKILNNTEWLRDSFGEHYADLNAYNAWLFKILASIRSMDLTLNTLWNAFSKCWGGKHLDSQTKTILIAIFVTAVSTTIPDLQFGSDVVSGDLGTVILIATFIETTARSARGLINVFLSESAHIIKNDAYARRVLLEELNFMLPTDERLKPPQIEAVSEGQAYVRKHPNWQTAITAILGFGSTYIFDSTQFLSSFKAISTLLSSIGLPLFPLSNTTAIDLPNIGANLASPLKFIGLFFALLATIAKTGLYTYAMFKILTSLWDSAWNRPAIPSQTNSNKCHTTQTWLPVYMCIGISVLLFIVFGTSGTAAKIENYIGLSLGFSILAALFATGPFFGRDCYLAITETGGFVAEKFRQSRFNKDLEIIYGKDVPSFIRNVMEHLRELRVTDKYFDTLAITDETYEQHCSNSGLSNISDTGLQNLIFVTQTGGHSSFAKESFKELVEQTRFLRIYLDEVSYKKILAKILVEKRGAAPASDESTYLRQNEHGHNDATFLDFN